MIADDADHLSAGPEVARIRDIPATGGSAGRQRAVRQAARDGGADEAEAMRAPVVDHLADTFMEGIQVQ